MSEVVSFTGVTRLPEAPETILEKAKAWKMTRCLVIGWNENGEFVYGGSHCEMAENVLLLEIAKKHHLANIET